MKSIISICSKIGILLAILLQMSCYEDKGNYDLHEINKVTILKNGSDTLKINQFDSLTVESLIGQSMAENNDNLTYKWSVFLLNPPISGVINEVLSDEKDLKVQFGLRPDNYTLLYTVTDKNTGVSVFKKYLLQVSSKLSEGWLMISENSAGDRDIDLLHPEGYAIPNLLSAANPGVEIPAKLHTVRVLTTLFGGSQNIFLLGEKESIRVKYTDFTKVSFGSDWFIEKISNSKPQEFRYDMWGGNAFYMDNGRIYSNQTDFRFGVTVGGMYHLSPYFLPQQSSDAGVFYDEISKKFLNYSRKQFSSFASQPNAPFNMNDVGMDVMFGGLAPSNQYSFLMKDVNQQPYVLRISNGGAVAKYPVGNAEGILQATSAAFSGLYLHIYYAVGNKLYLLDVEQNSSRLLYSFPVGTDITTMRLKQTRSSFVSFPDNNRKLAVGTYGNQEGKVFVFSIDNVGEFVDGTYMTAYEELEKPIALEYKNRK